MGFFDKLKRGLSKTTANLTTQLGAMFDNFTGANDDFFEDLEETLIMADLGPQTSVHAIERLRERVKSDALRGPEQVKGALVEILTEVLTEKQVPPLPGAKPAILLIIGVNGVGKTTTIGKLATRYKAEGERVLVAAGDTFRAAAAEQLSIWATRAGADIVRHGEGADPAAVVFDSLSAARARGVDRLIIDTAGRLHNKANLMAELAKIRRIIEREMPDAPVETLLVIDATTGQNGLAQARAFQETAGLSGIVLTKLDGTARGGIVFAIAHELDVPVRFVGVGEGADDLLPFDAVDFVRALLA